MIVTEAEARGKWCPFARVVSLYTKAKTQTAIVSNRACEGIAPNLSVEERQNPPSARCIATRCMAWKWDPSSPKSSGNQRCGYCGLA
jgi:hypothetical protein